jgi:hypothetical protein
VSHYWLRYSKSPTARWIEANGGAQGASDQRSEAGDTLPGTAWDVLEAPRTFPDLVAIVARTHGVEAQAAAPQIISLLDDLLSRGLVEEAERAPDERSGRGL